MEKKTKMPVPPVLKALILDADELQGKGASLALKNYFSEIVFTRSPLEAIVLARKNRFTLIISEINFAIMDGIEVIKNLKALSPQSEIFICSAHYNEAIKAELKQIGIDHFLEKPINIKLFKEEIQNIIKNKGA